MSSSFLQEFVELGNLHKFDKHLKKAGGHIVRNVVEITIKMKTIVRKTLNDKNTQENEIIFYIHWKLH